MHSVEVIGPFKGFSGYDRYTREFVRQFLRQGLGVQLTNLAGWSLEVPPPMREVCFDQLSTPVNADTVLHFTMPVHVTTRPYKRNVNYTMFEADRIPKDWAIRAAATDLIVVPTESSFRAWRNSGVPEAKIRICPLGVDGSFFSERTEPLPLRGSEGEPVLSYRCRFLNIAELRPRKNHLGLLRAWIRATKAKDNAILIVKLTVFDPYTLDQFQVDLTEMQSRLGRFFADAAPVIFLVDNILSEEQLRSLYQTATHYFSMSKGEGWDLVMMEAAAAGLHLIAPNHSAYASYLREEDAELIPASLVPAVFESPMRREDQIFFDGVLWWQPDENVAVETIQRIIRSDGQTKLLPRERIIAEYSWANAGHRLIQVLEELG
jgi:glycosyltransferase involved in cell wall biosynthesis